MLEYARALPVLPTPQGDNIVIITGAGGSGVLLSDAIVDNGLSLMEIPPDLDEAFRAFIPPFGAAGNPVDITGGEPPVHVRGHDPARSGGPAHPRARARLLAHDRHSAHGVRGADGAGGGRSAGSKGIEKPVVASLAGDTEVEEASQYLFERGVVAYPYTTEKPVAVLGAKYRWARAAGCWGAVHDVSGAGPAAGARRPARDPCAHERHGTGGAGQIFRRKGCST